MFKFQVQSVVFRGRSTTVKASRVATDGIAASLRSFSSAASRSDPESKEAPRLTIIRQMTDKPNRAERTAQAVGQLSSLTSNRPRGVDARSLAAKPAGAPFIRRVDISSPATNTSRPRRDGTSRPRTSKAPASYERREGSTGTRGHRGGRFPLEEETQEQEEEEEVDDVVPLEVEAGWRGTMGIRNYIPRTTLASLAAHLPPVATNKSPEVVTRTLANSLQALTGDTRVHTITPRDRIGMINESMGTMMWDAEERTELDRQLKDRSTKRPHRSAHFTIPTVSAEQKSVLLNALVLGRHENPKVPQGGDTIGTVDSYMRRNETYLAGDAAKLRAKLMTMLPKQSGMASEVPSSRTKKVSM